MVNFKKIVAYCPTGPAPEAQKNYQKFYYFFIQK